MRLLHTTKLQLEYFNGDSPPPYAILSHTWENEEVTFDDFSRNKDFRALKGWSKISRSAELANRKGFEYIWIDTCCIDKSSSTELSEAINSMFQWYKQSAICYAFLSDILASPADFPEQGHDLLLASRWFTRGWTLQELIAPAKVDFYDKAWQFLGSKSTRQSGFLLALARCSGVPITILQGSDLAHVSVAQRMSWASRRQTTRREDLAYCLMGIFGIHMPLLYGEGDNAFMRLQEEILKTTDDETLFAWKLPKTSDTAHETHFSGLLAPSIACFVDSSNIVSDSWRSSLPSIATTISRQGVQMEARLTQLPADKSESLYWAFLSCTTSAVRNDFHLILLQRLSEGEPRFIRARPDIMATLGNRHADGRISIILNRIDGFQFSQLALLCQPISDPETQPIFVARSPPPAKLHYPIRFSVLGDDASLPDLGFKTEAVACYDGDLKLRRTFSWPSHDSSSKNPTSFRLFYDSALQPITLDSQPIILAICKIRMTVSHFGIIGVESSASSTYLGLMIGLNDPPLNPCLTPPTYRIPWYSFTTWPGIEEGKLDGFPTPSDIKRLTMDALTPRGSHVMLSSPQETPVKYLGLAFQRTLRRSTSDYNVAFELKEMTSADALALSNKTSTHPRSPPSSAAMPPASADLQIQSTFSKLRLDADTRIDGASSGLRARRSSVEIVDVGCRWTRTNTRQHTWEATNVRYLAADLQNRTEKDEPVVDSNKGFLASDFASGLYKAVLALSSSILRQESWCLSSPPRPAPKPDSVTGNAFFTSHELISPHDTEITKQSMHDQSGSNDVEGDCYDQRSWNMVRLLLNEELNRLYFWKSHFSDEELDRITSDQRDIPILGILLSIAESLVSATYVSGDSKSAIHEPAMSLNNLAIEGRRIIQDIDSEEDDIGSIKSVQLEPFDTRFDGLEWLYRLSNEVDRLLRIRFSARLAIELSASNPGPVEDGL